MALCPHGVNHLQEMKDKLIAVSNKLLDNGPEFEPEQLEALRLERLALLQFVNFPLVGHGRYCSSRVMHLLLQHNL